MNTKYNMRIATEKFYNNGGIILASLENFENLIRESLNREFILENTIRKKKGQPDYPGIKAGKLNAMLREKMFTAFSQTENYDLNGETTVSNGVFVHNGKEGFDFSIYDDIFNLHQMYNYYMGEVGILEGDKKIYAQFSSFNKTKSEWKNTIDSLADDTEVNTNLICEKQELTIVGEFQFGNWALCYRDLFRLIKARDNPGVDFYVYVAATGNLKAKISSGTVCYESAFKIMEDYKNIINVPIWLIGLDVEEINA